MKTKLLQFSFTAFIFFFNTLNVKSQNNENLQLQVTKAYAIETIDGATITGTLTALDEEKIEIKTQSFGTITLSKSKISSMKEISETSFVNGKYWYENPSATRYIVGPSAISLRKGEGYYQNLYLFAHSFNVGITDHFSIGGGTEIISLILGQSPAFFFITPKIGYQVAPLVHLGAGVLYINANGLDENAKSQLGVGYGLATIGNRDNNITFGMGWGWRNYKKNATYYTPAVSESGMSNEPIITISGMTRLARGFALVTENWIYPTKVSHTNSVTNTTSISYKYQAVFSYGMRFIGERTSIDFGFINTPELASAILIGIPYIDFVIKFGGKGRKVK